MLGRRSQVRGKQSWNEMESIRLSLRVKKTAAVYRVIPRIAGYGIGRTTVQRTKFDRFVQGKTRNEQ